jgi:hypothetical protein
MKIQGHQHHHHHCNVCATDSVGEPGDHKLKTKAKGPFPEAEVRTLVDQGPSENRIDLTMVGDGYTASQKEDFFKDAKRMTDELFEGQTFASYLPLFNVHAVFVPSNDSGLKDGDKKDTALGLYRSPAGSKRAISVGKPAQARKAVSLARDTDYPILIANDKFYGGLGGEFAITTSSPESGSMVLRHELGHNFGDVGEEYDGGQVYKGANHSRERAPQWSEWMERKEEPQVARAVLAQYPWKNLKNGDQEFPFEVKALDDTQPLVGINLSSVGWQTPQDVEVSIDGKPVKLEGEYTEDRSFFSLKKPITLEPGTHTLKVHENVKDGNNVLGSVQVTNFSGNYDFNPKHIGAYPTFNDNLRLVGYRPTHESCLMRNMRTTEFCPIDKQNMWAQFLHKVSLIDSVEAKPLRNGNTQLEVKTLDLKGLDVKWYRTTMDGKSAELADFQGKRKVTVPQGQSGEYQAEVSFHTPEVRKYTEDFVDRQSVKVA